MGFSISLHSSERRSLIYWRVSCRRCRPLRRQSCAIYSSAAPAPNVRRCWCGSPFVICACQRDSRSFVCIPFQDPPRYGDLPVVKTNNPVSVQLFCDCGLSFVRAKYKLADDQPICCAFAPRYALWRPAAVPNRKKMQFGAFFCFWDPWIGSNGAVG